MESRLQPAGCPTFRVVRGFFNGIVFAQAPGRLKAELHASQPRLFALGELARLIPPAKKLQGRASCPIFGARIGGQLIGLP